MIIFDKLRNIEIISSIGDQSPPTKSDAEVALKIGKIHPERSNICINCPSGSLIYVKYFTHKCPKIYRRLICAEGYEHYSVCKKIDLEDSSFTGSKDYSFKVIRYTQSGSKSCESNPVTISVIAPTSTPIPATPTDIPPTNTPIPNTPTSKPPTPTPTSKPTKTLTIKPTGPDPVGSEEILSASDSAETDPEPIDSPTPTGSLPAGQEGSEPTKDNTSLFIGLGLLASGGGLYGFKRYKDFKTNKLQ